MRIRLFAGTLLLAAVPALFAQTQSDARDDTREKMRTLLEDVSKRSDVNVVFHQSSKQPYNFTGSMTGLKNAESLEIVISITKSDTIGFRVYPHINDGYINIATAKDPRGMMRTLLYYNDKNFLFWGSDESDDVFCGYTFTLESGFPAEAITVVLRSIRASDKFVGELRPMIDGKPAAR